MIVGRVPGNVFVPFVSVGGVSSSPLITIAPIILQLYLNTNQLIENCVCVYIYIIYTINE